MKLDYCVIIPTHGRPIFLQRSVDSVARQTLPASHIIIVDDASDTPVQATDFPTDIPITVIRHEKSQGGAAARNAGLLKAQNAIIAFLDDDDEWLPEKMSAQIKYLEANPDAGLVSCGHYRVEGGREYEETFPETFVRAYHQFDNFFGSFSFLCVRKSLIDSGVKLDARLPSLQDWDFALRCIGQMDFGIIETPLVRYHAHDQPRITTGNRNRIRGLRLFYFNHRSRLQPNARRWHLSRIVFERAKNDTGGLRIRRTLHSIAMSFSADLHFPTKTRSLLGRLSSVVLSRQAVLKLRSSLIVGLQKITTTSQPVASNK